MTYPNQPPYGAPPAQQMPYAPQRTSGIAIAALVVGIVGMCVPLLGIVAAVLGGVGLAKTSRPGVGGRGLAIAGLVLGVVGFFFSLLSISILLPSLNRARETANRVKCGSNMSQIFRGMILYTDSNRGQFPPDLATLAANEDLTPDVFTCPSGAGQPAKTMWTSDAAARAAGNLDYVYVAEGMNSQIGPNEPILIEAMSDHHDGGNVLYGDGHVEFELKSTIQQLLRNLPPRRLSAEESAAMNTR